MVKQNSLLKDLRRSNVKLKFKCPKRIVQWYPEWHSDLMEDVSKLEEAFTYKHMQRIIDCYSEENKTVRDVLDDKSKFYEVGYPIIQKANEVAESITGLSKRYSFKTKEVLESLECCGSVKKLEGIIEPRDYFRNFNLVGEKARYFGKGLIPDNESGVAGFQLASMIGLGILTPLFSHFGFNAPIGVSAYAVPLGVFGGLGISKYFINMKNNTPESLIKEPAERFGEDLKWMDETFDRIYRGVKGDE